MLYFIRYTYPGCPIKMGYARDEEELQRRLANARRSWAPDEIELMARAEGCGSRTQRELRELLAAHQAHHHNWLRPNVAVLTFVAWMGKNPTAEPADVMNAARDAIGVARVEAKPRPLGTGARAARQIEAERLSMTRSARRRRMRERIEREIKSGDLVVRQAENL